MAGSKEERKTLPTGNSVSPLNVGNNSPPREVNSIFAITHWRCHGLSSIGSLRCSQCKQTYYCSNICQRRDWAAHKIVCKPVQQNFHKLEDYKSPFETKNMEVKDEGTVTEFKHPGDFYVQLYSSEVLEYMNQLSASLKETYANKAHEEDYVPVKGEICVAKYTVDQAIRCFVASVIPAEGNWSNDCIKTIKSLLMEQYCSLKIVDILKEEGVTFAVDVMMTSSGKFLDHVLIEMGYGVKPKGQNSKKQSTDSGDLEDVRTLTAENKIVVDRSDLIPKVLTLNVGDEFCGVVAHVQTPEDFFCQQLQSGRRKVFVYIYIRKNISNESLQFSEDDQWYRASVLAYASEESVLVGYVDYGNFEILSLTRLCPITPKLLELPMQAIKCVLAGM
ncbi:hypothetical protein Celaphus_00008705 [Cervus elaphus hippelaphus]|uniref:TDRD1 n=1 Tax=Cervus elaphus hippelaphus TaxID=46360 RepID=A0A212CNH4_CEREH|nr:hypothetical protein Celaphus_00008705 [Cervus elaphus hippelaphus]